jgi:predicted MFS family arabinose efflux permease
MTAVAAAVSHPHQYRVMGVIGAGHAASHFFHLVVPALFPLIKDDLGVSYAELGLLTAVFFVTSGIFQTVSGFVVDHIGARQTLFAGLGFLAGAIFLCGFAPGYTGLLVLMGVAGIGNSVFHPADYAILSGSIDKGRLGRAYGIHTLGGSFGWAAAPPSMLALAHVLGWRGALMIGGLAGFVILALLVSQASQLEDGRQAREHERQKESIATTVVTVLLSLPVLLCFLYFIFLAIAQIGIQNFLPPILDALDGIPLATAAAGLTAFLLGSGAGTAVGMIAADRFERHHILVAAGLLPAAAVIFFIAEASLGGAPLIVALAIAGACIGFTMPARDMVVRAATPPGATGRVFGFVYSGLDAGSAIAPVLIGLMLDHGLPRQTLWLVTAAVLLALCSALVVRRTSRRQG